MIGDKNGPKCSHPERSMKFSPKMVHEVYKQEKKGGKTFDHPHPIIRHKSKMAAMCHIENSTFEPFVLE